MGHHWLKHRFVCNSPHSLHRQPGAPSARPSVIPRKMNKTDGPPVRMFATPQASAASRPNAMNVCDAPRLRQQVEASSAPGAAKRGSCFFRPREVCVCFLCSGPPRDEFDPTDYGLETDEPWWATFISAALLRWKKLVIYEWESAVHWQYHIVAKLFVVRKRLRLSDLASSSSGPQSGP